MIASALVLLALAGGPQQDPHAPAAPTAEAGAVQPGHGAPVAEAPHGEAGDAHAAQTEHGDGVDFMHHIQDSREWELPFGGTVHLPPAHSWEVAGIDFTPTKHVLFLLFAAVLTVATLLMGATLAARAERGRTAGKRHNLIETMVLFVRNEVVMPNVGHGGEKYAPFVCTLFFFILFANLLGLIPYGSTATANVSVTAGLALLTFVVVEIGGLIAVGPRQYLGTLFFRPAGMHPVAGWVMAIALFPIEALGKFVRPGALAIRLMANMTAGHIVLLAIISLIFVFGSWLVLAGPLLMAVAVTFLEIFVAFLQAFIFAMLSSVFIGLVRHAH